jgi:hypothetical protein
MGGHSLLLPLLFGGHFDAQTGSRPRAAKTLGACLPGRKRGHAGGRIRPVATNGSASPEALPRSGPIGPEPQLWPAQASASCPSRGDPTGRPRLATRPSHLGRGVDPRDARRGSTSARLADPPDDLPLVPGRRVGTSPGRPTTGLLLNSGQPTPSDLADRCLRTHPPGRPNRSVLASDLGRGDRGRLEDGRFPPSVAGLRSTLAPLRQR